MSGKELLEMTSQPPAPVRSTLQSGASCAPDSTVSIETLE